VDTRRNGGNIVEMGMRISFGNDILSTSVYLFISKLITENHSMIVLISFAYVAR